MLGRGAGPASSMIMDRESLERHYWKAKALIAPGLKTSQCLYEDLVVAHVSSTSVWLDLGCGHSLLPAWRSEKEKELVALARLVVGVDGDMASLSLHGTVTNRVQGDITYLAFADESFDLITANTVFEHLTLPGKQMIEMARVLKKGGRIVIHTPNRLGYSTLAARVLPRWAKDRVAWILQGRKLEDIYPTYYRANSRSNLEYLASAAGLKTVSVRLVCTGAQCSIVPGLVVLELLWIRLLLTKFMRPLRTNILAVFEKPAR